MQLARHARRGEHVTRRASLVSRGLLRLGVSAADRIAVLVCDQHAEDLTVALTAITGCRAVPLAFGVDLPAGELTARLADVRGGIMLACAEGVEAWRATGVPMRVIGDGPETLWWRAFELREMVRAQTALPTSA